MAPTRTRSPLRQTILAILALALLATAGVIAFRRFGPNADDARGRSVLDEMRHVLSDSPHLADGRDYALTLLESAHPAAYARAAAGAGFSEQVYLDGLFADMQARAEQDGAPMVAAALELIRDEVRLIVGPDDSGRP